MRKFLLLFPLVLLVLPCSAQLCIVDTAQPNDTFAYMGTEVRALTIIREAVNLSAEMKTVPLPGDPDHQQAMVNYYVGMQSIDEHYACAARLLGHYKPSTNQDIQNSVDTLLTAIEATKTINATLRGMVEHLNKPPAEVEPHADDASKALADIKSTQHVVFKMMLGGVKESTFSIVRGEGMDTDWKPTAFTITRSQHDTLLTAVRDLAAGKTAHANYVDLCAEILLETLNEPLPLTGEVATKR
jgi:hypothetical protein